MARFASTVANALTLASVPGPRRCRRASQPGSLYVSQTFPLASCQPRILRGKSIPIVWLDCISGVPAFGLPKISSSVGRSGIATETAAAAWSIRAKIVMSLALRSASSRSRVSLTEYLLATVISPSSEHCRCLRFRFDQVGDGDRCQAFEHVPAINHLVSPLIATSGLFCRSCCSSSSLSDG